MSERVYPYEEGDIIVLGPECFIAKDGTVLNWRGRNYVPQDEVLSEAHITEALGYLSSVLADRAGAWDGQHPAWFPEPPEWLVLWEDAVAHTGPNTLVDGEAEEVEDGDIRDA